MTTKQQLLDVLDRIEKDIGTVIAESVGWEAIDSGVEPLAIHQARINYAQGSLWLRHYIDKKEEKPNAGT